MCEEKREERYNLVKKMVLRFAFIVAHTVCDVNKKQRSDCGKCGIKTEKIVQS